MVSAKFSKCFSLCEALPHQMLTPTASHWRVGVMTTPDAVGSVQEGGLGRGDLDRKPQPTPPGHLPRWAPCRFVWNGRCASPPPHLEVKMVLDPSSFSHTKEGDTEEGTSTGFRVRKARACTLEPPNTPLAGFLGVRLWEFQFSQL